MERQGSRDSSAPASDRIEEVEMVSWHDLDVDGDDIEVAFLMRLLVLLVRVAWVLPHGL